MRASPFRSARTAGCTTSPSWVTRTPAVISSAGSSTSAPSATRWESSATTLRAYAVDAARRHRGGEVAGADHGHAAVGHHGALGHRADHVAAELARGQVDHHRAGPHRGQRRGGDQHRRRPARHLRGGDDARRTGPMRGGHRVLLAACSSARQRPGVTAVAGGRRPLRRPARRTCAPVEAMSAAGGRAHVVAGDDGAEPAGGADRLQPGHAGAEHQHLAGRTVPAAVISIGK